MSQPQLIQIKLSRFDAQPWGFRLQGGVDFAQPLVVQKVNGGSLAEKAGLIPGDALIRINDVDVYNLRHKDAQDIVVRSGNNFVLTIQRGGSTWRPHITPTGNVPQPQHISPYLQTVTKTSLAHKQQDSQHIGCGYNNAARPYANGGDASVKSIVNKQYNTPVGIYSDESIAETLSAQAEVLAGGVLGVNFKKNEKEYQPDKSEVLKFLREEETGQSSPEPPCSANFYWTQSHAIGGNERRTPLLHQHQHHRHEQQDECTETKSQSNTTTVTIPQPAAAVPPAEPADPRIIMMPVCQALQGPKYKAEMEAAAAALQNDDGPRQLSASGHPACALCGVGIVGVFVRIKDKNLHVECFKCATCGTSLKNQGYYNYNNKLYCEIHAKLAALQNPPAGTDGYVPVPIKPNTKLSANTISYALNSHGYSDVPVANGGSAPPVEEKLPTTASAATTLSSSTSSVSATTAIGSTIANATLLDSNSESSNRCDSEQLIIESESNHPTHVEIESKMLTNQSLVLEPGLDEQPFGEYVTLTGSVIRSVAPPGKGVNIHYKVNQGYARPFGSVSGPPVGAPRSPVAYPPQRPAANAYATLPRCSIGQQVQLNTTNSASTYVYNSNQAFRSSFQSNTGNAITDMTQNDLHEVIEETTEELEHSEVLFPPPSPLSHLRSKATSSGLHKADTIPKYQRNWTILPTQIPIRTPEPPELRENVPLAFVDAPVVSTISNPVYKPMAQISTTIADSNQHKQEKSILTSRPSITSTNASLSETKIQQQQTSPTQQQSKMQSQIKNTAVPTIVEERVAPQVTMAFQPLYEHLQTDESQFPSRPYTPSMHIKPVPVIPFYQTPEALCLDECPALHAKTYDRHSVSPIPDRARSPAPGPPPNPLAAIRSSRPTDNELSSLSPRVLQAGSITTGQSYLGAQQQQQSQILSHYEQSSNAESHNYSEKPEEAEERPLGDYTVQRQEKEINKADQTQSRLESQTKMHVDNTQIERRRLVTEEYEHTQSARSVEIRTGSKTTTATSTNSATDCRQSYGMTGYVANQARRLSGLEQEITNLTSQSQAISARAATLTDTSFPQINSLEPATSKFPLKQLLPPHDEPERPSYVFSSTPYNKMVGPPPGFNKQEHQQQKQQQMSTAYEATSVSQQKKSLSTYTSSNFTTSSCTSSSLSSQANAVNVGNLTKASITNNNQSGSASAMTADASGIFPVTGTFCRPGHTRCRQQQLQALPTATGETNYNQNINVQYLPNASTGITDNKTNAQAAAIAIKAKAINTTSQVNSVTSSASAAGATNASAAAAAPTSFPPPQKLDNEKPNTDLDGSTGVGGKGAFGATSAPKRGRGIINKAVAPGVRVPLCSSCNIQIRGPFITALGRIWCPEHFICVNANCRRPLQDIGFVEEKGDLYCEFCFEKYLAPSCSKCGGKIKGDCLNAIGKQFHPECFTCGHCGKLFGNTPFFLEDGKAYCEADWNELFTTKCFACGFPVEAGDRWVEALSHNYHSQCFNCTYCKQNLEGQSFYNKGGRPFCKNHAR
ncbi:PDZ and LIM domain protein Zasp isoform X2 [Eurosta solidaginis]|uniref:PDZ and LIM domain protein Zasp isoform X2 n=1 Tax=Eurosta solidaginis TaxID=178769 RepID=UPI0035316EE8